MRAIRAGLVGLLLSLSGCSVYSDIHVYNDAGSPAIFHVKPLNGGGPYRVHHRVQPERARRFYIPQVMNERGAYVLLVTVGRCDYVYQLPNLVDVPGATTQVQLEPDLSLHLMPQTARRVIAAAALPASQGYGFPVKPVFQVCKRSSDA